MVRVVGVRFRNTGKVYYFDPGDLELSEGDKAIVETVRGLECGDVVSEARPVPDEEITQPLRKVVRKATPEDEAAIEANKEKERRALRICLEKIAAHGLPMKLVDVEYTFDGSKIVFFFTADGRVDFRELVKDLASVFRTRIELRQIGVRDEAKMLGGLGPCGRPLCCTAFLRDFEPVSIRMAKDQNLSLNPTKISGICGRLMCCLKYEHNVYKDLRQGLPALGSEIETEAGPGKVVELDVLKGIAAVKLADGKTTRVVVRAPDAGRAQEEEGELRPCPGGHAIPGWDDAPTGGGVGDARGDARPGASNAPGGTAPAASGPSSLAAAGQVAATAAAKPGQDRAKKSRRRRRRPRRREGGQVAGAAAAPSAPGPARAPGAAGAATHAGAGKAARAHEPTRRPAGSGAGRGEEAGRRTGTGGAAR